MTRFSRVALGPRETRPSWICLCQHLMARFQVTCLRCCDWTILIYTPFLT